MGITHDLSPALHVARVFFVLPFSKFDHTRLILRSPLWLRFLTFIVHFIFLNAYIYYACLTLQKFKHATNMHLIQEASTLATLLMMQIVDITNAVRIIILSQTSCNLIGNILSDLVMIERKIMKCKSSKHALWTSVYMCCLYASKLIITYTYLKRKDSIISMSPTISSATVIATEHLLLVLCLEIRKHLYCINKNLTKAVKIGHCKIAKLSRAYDMLSNAQDKVNKQFGLFLLLNLSQLIFNIVYLPLWTMSSCFQNNIEKESICSIQTLFAFGFIFLTYIFRFMMILWGCSLVTSEAECTAVKSSCLFRRNMDEDTNLELNTLLQLSLSRRLSFTACGLFTIDLPLMFTAGGAVSSYLFLVTQLK